MHTRCGWQGLHLTRTKAVNCFNLKGEKLLYKKTNGIDKNKSKRNTLVKLTFLFSYYLGKASMGYVYFIYLLKIFYWSMLLYHIVLVSAVQQSESVISSVAQLCLTLCDPMNHSMPGLPVQHQLLEFTQTCIHRVSDAIQPSHPLSSPSPPAPNPSQHQSLFQ